MTDGSQLTLAVHNGMFHADDVLCVAMIRHYVRINGGCVENIRVIRSRRPEELAQADIVMDVGMGRYDHHQVDNAVQANGIKMSACGKVFDDLYADEPALVEVIHATCLDAVQAVDNGQDPVAFGLTPSEYLWVKPMNVQLGEVGVTEAGQFAQAVEMAEILWTRQLVRARAIAESAPVMEALLDEYAEDAEDDDGIFDDGILDIGALTVHWAFYVDRFNAEHPGHEVLEVIFCSPGGQWTVRAPKLSGGRMAAMPEGYRTLNEDGQLVRPLPEGCTFVHNTGFVAAFTSYGAALAMAREAVKQFKG